MELSLNELCQYPLATIFNLKACQDVRAQLSVTFQYKTWNHPQVLISFSLLPLQHIAQDFPSLWALADLSPDKSLRKRPS